MRSPEIISVLRPFIARCERHRMASSMATLAMLHLAVMFLWPVVRPGQMQLSPPAQVVHLTELNLAPPETVVEPEILKIDEANIEINKEEKTDKTQKSTPTASGDTYLPFFEADIQPRPLIDIRSIMVYPDQARRMNVQGTVAVELDISADGHVRNARIVRSAGWGFDDEVLRKIRMVRFRPALKDKEPIAVTVQIPVEFVLR